MTGINIEPIYCFEYNFKTKLENNRIITNFVISDYWNTKELYGVSRYFISKDLIQQKYQTGNNIGGLFKFNMLSSTTLTMLSFNQVLAYYNVFLEIIEIGNKTNSCIDHCKEYKYYYERLVELLQLIIAKWDDWN